MIKEFFKRWFTLPPQTNHKPSSSEIAEITDSVKQGTDSASTAVHKQTNQYAKDLLRLQKQVKIVRRSAERLTEEIDTAVAIALATGKFK